MSDDPRRYTERELSLILAKAGELSGSSRSTERLEDGLTIEEIKSIAAEAGLDPDSVARAARLVPEEGRTSLFARVMGGSFRVRRAFSLPGELTDERAQGLLSAARRTMLANGEGVGNASGVSWSTRQAGQVFVSAHGEGAETRVQVTVDKRGASIPPLFLGTAGLVVTLSAAIAVGDNALGDPYLVLAGGGAATAAWVWSALRRIARKTRTTVESLVEAIGEVVDRERAG